MQGLGFRIFEQYHLHEITLQKLPFQSQQEKTRLTHETMLLLDCLFC